MENTTPSKNGFWIMEAIIDESVNEINPTEKKSAENFHDSYGFYPDADF